MSRARVAATALALLAAFAAFAAPARAGVFEVVELGPGVHAVVRIEPLGLANHSNSVFVVGPDDVLVVDTPFTLAATREVIAAIRAVTRKPVRWLVNTHWHDDHTFGNEVYRDSFPDVEIIATGHTAVDMAGLAVENRRGQLADGAEAIAEIADAAARDTAFDGTAMDDGDRAAYASTLRIARQYLAEAPAARPALPTHPFEGVRTIRQGDRVIEIRSYGAGNTSGDAIVWLPAERILVAGDLVQHGPPSAAHAAIGPWIATLDSLATLAPRRIVPGHGKIETDATSIPRLRDVLADLRGQVAAAVARGETLEQARASVSLDEARSTLAGSGKFARFFFDGWFAGPAVAAAWREATAAAAPTPSAPR